MERVRSVIADDATRNAIRDWIRCLFDEGIKINPISIDHHLQDLIRLSTNPAEQLKIVNEAIKRGWKALFPAIKEKAASPKKPNQQTKQIRASDYR